MRVKTGTDRTDGTGPGETDETGRDEREKYFVFSAYNYSAKSIY
jgi:hypothetical protein